MAGHRRWGGVLRGRRHAGDLSSNCQAGPLEYSWENRRHQFITHTIKGKGGTLKYSVSKLKFGLSEPGGFSLSIRQKKRINKSNVKVGNGCGKGRNVA